MYTYQTPYSPTTTPLADVDPLSIAYQTAKAAMGKLGKEDTLEILKGLPKEYVSGICEAGFWDEYGPYIPWAIGGLALLFILK